MTDTRIPLLTPLLNLLRSRKFTVQAISLLTSILVIQFPELEPVREQMAVIIAIVFTVAFGVVLPMTIAYEDANGIIDVSGILEDVTEHPEGTTEEEWRRTLNAVLDEWLTRNGDNIEAAKPPQESHY